MTAPIEDVSNLPGREVRDQAETEVGEITDVYATEDGFPMWVAVQTKAGIGKGPRVFIPLARLKEEDGELRRSYGKSHILKAPEVDVEDSISAECGYALRTYYRIGTADQELWSDNKGYRPLTTRAARRQTYGQPAKWFDANSSMPPSRESSSSLPRLSPA
jgi:hypothetical protein